MTVASGVCMTMVMVCAVGYGLVLRAGKQELLSAFQQTAQRHANHQRAQLSEERKAYLLHVVASNALDQVDNLREILSGLNVAERKVLADSLQVDGGVQKSALFLACLNRSPSMVELLLWANANVTLGRTDEGTTPLHLAAGWLHSEEIVELLLDAKDRSEVTASLLTKPASGGLQARTPVFWAGFYGHRDTQQRLLAWMSSAGWRYVLETDIFQSDHDSDETLTWRSLASDW